MKFKKYAVMVLFCLLNTSALYAGEAVSSLEKFLAKTKTMQADFQQKLLDANGVLLQHSAGLFKLKRPGKFSWDYFLPYPQKIVSNGVKIWIYDEELEQVSIKRFSQVLSSSPVILLNKDSDLSEDYTVLDKGLKDNQHWVLLTPKEKDSEFKRIEVGMAKGHIQTMRLYDGFDQTTIIEFENLKMNLNMDDKQFHFNLPKGVDVVGDFQE